MGERMQRSRTDILAQRFAESFHDVIPRVRAWLTSHRPPPEHVEIPAPAPELIRNFCRYSKWAGAVAILVGYHVLLGWAFDIESLTRPWPGFAAMPLSAAISAVLAGTGLYLLQTDRPISRKNQFRSACAISVLFLAFLSLCENAFSWGPGLDHWITIIPEAGHLPEEPRMAVMSAITFIMIGAALLIADWKRCWRAAEALALAAAALSLLGIAGYLYEARSFTGQMPLYSALVGFLLTTGILSARSSRGLLAKVTSNSFGGIMARRLLPATLLIPVVLGWLQYRGRVADWYEVEPGMALFTVLNVLMFLAVVWWGIDLLHRMDTKRRKAERDLQDTAAKLARSNADLEQFAYVASHDLKEPLRAVTGSVQILQARHGEHLDGHANEVIRHTVEGALRMQTLIDDLLTYSRLTTREAALEETDFTDVLQGAVANLDLAIKESKALITHDPMPTLHADGTQFSQVLQNLISNAIKYRSNRTLKIHVGAEERAAEWVFSVRDNGIGIAPQYADRIFRIFQRLHTRREYPGTGIGLAVCKKVVERHGGRIWVESELEEGSTFYFTLPKL